MTEDRPDDTPDDGSDDIFDDSSDRVTESLSPIRSGQRLDKLAELEEERRYLFRSLKDLENERAAGDVDEVDYETLKNGYTVRAASVLRQIEAGQRALAPKRQRNWKQTIAVSFAVLAFSVAVAAALAAAFGERGANDEITGFSPADDTRTTLASARAALSSAPPDFVQAQQLFLEADQSERERGNDNAEARAYLGWTTALIAVAQAGDDPIDQRQLDISLLALNQAISIDPSFADPYCFVAIIEFNFNGDAETALPFVEQCESNDPPAEVAGLVEGFAGEIRAAAEEG